MQWNKAHITTAQLQRQLDTEFFKAHFLRFSIKWFGHGRPTWENVSSWLKIGMRIYTPASTTILRMMISRCLHRSLRQTIGHRMSTNSGNLRRRVETPAVSTLWTLTQTRANTWRKLFTASLMMPELTLLQQIWSVLRTYRLERR